MAYMYMMSPRIGKAQLLIHLSQVSQNTRSIVYMLIDYTKYNCINIFNMYELLYFIRLINIACNTFLIIVLISKHIYN